MPSSTGSFSTATSPPSRTVICHRAAAVGNATSFGDHSIATFSAELRPDHGQLGPGDLLYQANCEPCGWHSVSNTENDVVEAWHDHGVPGWRELPIIPAQIRVSDGSGGLTKIARAWIAKHYPTHMQIPGAPIITERARYATRHVNGRSPWGGYDIASVALDRSDPELERLEPPPHRAGATALEAAPPRRPAGTHKSPAVLSR
ncbi:DUF6349 family protein [Leucobacter triazinivorans]|uniref:DUF6349 family protein n=1 Tax=Leucobacter triazinivorans TaxID=1784719 RepID=UPI001F0DB58D|nr:DUF6349 family protein [Leucobacter triazinivorans]